MATKKKEKTIKKNDKAGKEEALKEVLAKIEKAYGDGSIMKLGSASNMDIKTISTGSINLDEALGVGGLPRGRIVEIYGAESSGKTTLTLHVIAEAQKNGGMAAFVDAEHALDPVYAKALGVDIDNLLISQPNSGEEALDIVELLSNSGAVDVIVVDSVAALVPKAEVEGNISDLQMGLQARLMAKGLRKITSSVSRSECLLIFINQIREKIGGISFGGVPQTTTSGGRALKFASTVRIEIKKTGTVKQGDDAVGNDVTAKVIKNKVAPPFKEAKFSIFYGTGISRESEILNKALELSICKKSGSWFSFGDERLGQGLMNVIDKMRADAELTEKIYTAVKEKEAENLTKKDKNKKKSKEVEADDIPDSIELDDNDTIDLDDVE